MATFITHRVFTQLEFFMGYPATQYVNYKFQSHIFNALDIMRQMDFISVDHPLARIEFCTTDNITDSFNKLIMDNQKQLAFEKAIQEVLQPDPFDIAEATVLQTQRKFIARVMNYRHNLLSHHSKLIELAIGGIDYTYMAYCSDEEMVEIVWAHQFLLRLKALRDIKLSIDWVKYFTNLNAGNIYWDEFPVNVSDQLRGKIKGILYALKIRLVPAPRTMTHLAA